MKSAYYAFHDGEGRIVGAFFGKPGEVDRNRPAGTTAVSVGHMPNAATDYISNGELVARPPQDAVLNGLVLSSLPDPCDVVIEGATYPVTGGTVTLEFGLPGDYTVTVIAFPFLDTDFTVTAP